MKAKIKSEHRKKFNPFFRTVIMGRPTNVSLKDAESNAEKWAKTPIGPLYENYEELLKKVEKRTKKPDVTKLDMNDAERGYLFDPEYKSEKQKAIDNFKEKQSFTLQRRKDRVKRELEAIKAQNEAQEKAIAEAVKKAKKTAKPKTSKANKNDEKAEAKVN